VDFNAEYVQLSLSGAILFDSGKADFPEDAYPIMDKISAILEQYDSNIIEVEGHTDNVPISSQQFESNDVLSMYRALTIADYIRDHTSLNPAHVKSSGRGAYVPVADNSTAEGRARNRRVEIKIYNSYNSDVE
jgi:chemotaxis protein MotB